MSPLTLVLVLAGVWSILAGFVILVCWIADEDRYPTPRCPRRYTAPGDGIRDSYRSWGGKGRTF